MPTKDLVIRPSTVQSYMYCGGRPGYRGTEGFNYYPNEALLFGSAMHWEIEQRMAGNSPTLHDLELELHRIWVKDLPESVQGSQLVYLNKVTTKAQRLGMAKSVRQAVDEWEIHVLPNLPESEVTAEMTMRALAGRHGDYDVYVQGTADAIWLEDGTIVDWKSANAMWKPMKVEAQIQPIAYPWLVKESFSVDIKEFTFWVYDKAAQLWAPFTRKLKDNPKQTGAFRLAAVNAAVALEEGTWTWTPAGQAFHASRGWHCSPKYCDAWDVCWGKHLIQDGKQDLPAIKMKEKFG